MAKLYLIQNSFTGGEISPRLLGRTDLAQYQNSVREMYNCYPFLHGGCTRRQGTRYIWTLPEGGTQPPKLIKFVHSRDISYLLVIHDGRMYFVNDKEVVGGTVTPTSINVPWADDELDSLRFTQQGNIMIFAHPNHPPKRLARLSASSFSLSDISFLQYAVGDYWYRTEPIELKIISDSDIDTNYNVGQYWEWQTVGTSVTVQPTLRDAGGTAAATTPGACVITKVSGSGGDGVWTATCIYSDADRTEWQIETPDETFPVLTWATGNYPQSVTFYQQRLWFGGSPNDPQTIWGSKIADYENFTVGPEDNDAVQFTIAAGNYDPIIHLTSAAQALLPLSYSTEFIAAGGAGAITASNVTVAPQTYHGANDVNPMSIGTDTLFVQRDGKKIRSIYFDINQSQNLAKDLTLFAEHITGNGIVDTAFAQEPDYIIWGVREDGQLITITYQREESVTGWARHQINGAARSVAVVPEGDHDVVYVAVEREQATGTEYTIEVFGEHYLDSYQTYTTETPTAIWSVDPRWEGMEVSVVADGFYAGEKVVTNGEIDIQDDASAIVVGLNYENYVTLLHPEPETGQTSQGRAMSIDKLTMRFQDTIHAYVRDTDNVRTVIPFVDFSEGIFNEPVAPYTGDKTENLTGWAIDNKIRIGQDLPLPWTLLAVVMRVTVNDQ